MLNFALRIIARRLLPFSFGRESFPGPLGERRGFVIADVRDGVFTSGSNRMQTGKVSNHPLAVVFFPVKRCLPLLLFDCFPTFGEPPAKVLIRAVAHELEELTVCYRGFVDLKIL